MTALRKELWAFGENRIAVRFQYECHDRDGQWCGSYGRACSLSWR
jgi:nuclear transport factor 2 (NTF2) superfamily protein